MAATGTLTLTQNSATVTGLGTAFTTALAAGGFIVATVGGTGYTLGIKSIESNTSLTLNIAYNGPTASGVVFDYVPQATLNLITSALAAQVTYALRAANLDKNNWQQIFSQTGNVTVNLPDGSSYTGPAWGGLLKKDGSVSMTANLLTTGLELIASQPYIDFHYGQSTNDYTVRIINSEASSIEVSAATGSVSFRVNGGMRVGGASFKGALNIYGGNGDANMVWGLSQDAGTGDFVLARGSAAVGSLDIGDSRLKNCRGLMCKQGYNGAYGANHYQFYWSGSQLQAWVDSSSIGYVTVSSTSDRQLKKDIIYRDDADVALQEVLKWRPAMFKMKARGIIPETEDQLGFIANDMVAVSPECVSGKGLPDDYDIEADPNNPDAYFLNQVPMIAKLAQSVQAMQKQISARDALIDDLTERLKALDGLDQ